MRLCNDQRDYLQVLNRVSEVQRLFWSPHLTQFFAIVGRLYYHYFSNRIGITGIAQSGTDQAGMLQTGMR